MNIARRLVVMAHCHPTEVSSPSGPQLLVSHFWWGIGASKSKKLLNPSSAGPRWMQSFSLQETFNAYGQSDLATPSLRGHSRGCSLQWQSAKGLLDDNTALAPAAFTLGDVLFKTSCLWLETLF